MSADEIGGYGITGHYGRGGSGKSRDIVETDIIPALQKGRKVYTNIPLLIDGIMTYYRGIDYKNIKQCTHEDLKNLIKNRMALGKEDAGEVAHSLIVWDEIQDDLPSGFKSRRGEDGKAYEEFRDAFIAWLAWARHDDAEFIWATQHFASVDVELRRKTHMYVQHEHLFHLGLKKTWAARTQLPDSQTGDPIPGAGTERTFGENAIIYRCYKSSETGNHKQSERFKMQIPKKIFIILGVAVITLIYAIYSYATGPNIMKGSGAGKSLEGMVERQVNLQQTDTKAETQTNQAIKQTNEQLAKGEKYAESEICIYGNCHAINGGVIEWTRIDPIVENHDSIKTKLRPGILERDIQRLPDGSGSNMPGN